MLLRSSCSRAPARTGSGLPLSGRTLPDRAPRTSRPPADRTLTITLTGTGSGTVTSAPAGLDCACWAYPDLAACRCHLDPLGCLCEDEPESPECTCYFYPGDPACQD